MIFIILPSGDEHLVLVELIPPPVRVPIEVPRHLAMAEC